MKRITQLLMGLLVTFILFSAFTTKTPGSLRGRVNPAEGGNRAVAISATDTFTANITQGAFVMTNVKAGAYNLIIEAKAPYSNTSLSNVSVQDGQVTDVGEIQLMKQ